MATYNFTNGSIAGVPVQTQYTPDENQPFILRHIIDLSKQNLDAGDGDVGQVLIIPAGVTVLNAWIRIITAETANGTLDLGITGVNVDQWGDALAVDSAAGSIVGGTLTAPYYFAAADTLDVLATTDTADVDLDGLKFEVSALCVKQLNTY